MLKVLHLQVKSVLTNVSANQTLSVKIMKLVADGARFSGHKVAPENPSLSLKNNVYNRLGASVENVRETQAYVCLCFETCGSAEAHLATLWVAYPRHIASVVSLSPCPFFFSFFPYLLCLDYITCLFLLHFA